MLSLASKYLPNVDKQWPLITKLSKAKAIKQSHDSQNHKNKKAFKFNYVLISQNTKSWKTSLVRISIPIEPTENCDKTWQQVLLCWLFEVLWSFFSCNTLRLSVCCYDEQWWVNILSINCLSSVGRTWLSYAKIMLKIWFIKLPDKSITPIWRGALPPSRPVLILNSFFGQTELAKTVY